MQTEPVVIATTAPETVGKSTGKPFSWSAVLEQAENLLPHPAGDTISQYMLTGYGDQTLAIGFVEGESGWVASADLDGDGTITENESVQLGPADADKPSAVLQGTVQRGAVPVPVPIRVDTWLNTGTRVFGYGVNVARFLTLPNDVKARIRTGNGVFDHPSARIIVDENGDGEEDWANRLVAFSVEEGIVQAQGARWRFTISPDGATVTLQPTDEAPPGLRVGGKAPDFSVTASDGEVHTLARYRGAPLLLDFWATWCGPCIALHPKVEAFAARHKVSVLGISANDDQATVDRWLKKNPTPWPSSAEGPEGPTIQAYGVVAYPSQAAIDADGRLVALGSFDAIRRAFGEKP